jgi:transposase
LPWEQVRESVQVKLIEQAGELYILSRSAGRVLKERSMRRRRLKRLCKRLGELQQQKLSRDELLIKLGAANKEAGHAYRLVELHWPTKDPAVTPQTFTVALNRNKLRTVRRREGRYLLRSTLTREPPALLWQYYIQLTEIEQAFKELKSDLCIRPIYHPKDSRIEAHIFVAFVAY